MFDLNLRRDILSTRLGRVSSKDRGEKSKQFRSILSTADIEDSLPLLRKSTKRLKDCAFFQLDNSLPHPDDVSPPPKYDSHNQLIPQTLQLKRFDNSQRYNSYQNQLIQDLSVKLIAVVMPKPLPPPLRTKSRKTSSEHIRVRKLREENCDYSYSLPKPLAGPRNPSPLRQELARASTL